MIAAASADEPHDRALDELLRLGERLGYLTYEMLNDMLPDEVIAQGKLDAFIDAIDRKGIRLIDAANAPRPS